MIQIQINNFDYLITFIQEHDLNREQINELIHNSIGCYISNEYKDKEQLITTLKTFWNKWSHTTERPLFIEF